MNASKRAQRRLSTLPPRGSMEILASRVARTRSKGTLGSAGGSRDSSPPRSFRRGVRRPARNLSLSFDVLHISGRRLSRIRKFISSESYAEFDRGTVVSRARKLGRAKADSIRDNKIGNRTFVSNYEEKGVDTSSEPFPGGASLACDRRETKSY